MNGFVDSLVRYIQLNPLAPPDWWSVFNTLAPLDPHGRDWFLHEDVMNSTYTLTMWSEHLWLETVWVHGSLIEYEWRVWDEGYESDVTDELW